MNSSDLKLFASLAQLLSQQSDSNSKHVSAKVTYCSATCPDQQCQHKLFFPQHEVSVECPNCGQRHSVVDLPELKVLPDDDQRFAVEVSQLRKMYSANKRSAEQVKVKGVSNAQCKLLSPLLSTYGMDKNDHPCTLQELGVGEIFDCSKLSNRSFAIEESHLQVLGYGLDRSGSRLYLKDTLEQLRGVNNDQDCLVPLHADGDGHCLVHAISRCLVGRELFWHALRSNLHSHLSSNLQRYQDLFKEFYSTEEWEGLVAEAGPDWTPPDGQTLGLCNIHVYGLANVLRRPIILLDSLMGMQSSGDYSGIFLPTMFTPEECSFKDKLNSPIVIAWSNSGRNHFIPLVPVKGRPLPRLPPHLQPKVWGAEATQLSRYVTVGADGCMEVCGGKELGEKYLLRLVHCMEKLFLEKNKVVPSLVTDVEQHVYKATGYVGVAADSVVASTRAAVEGGRLFRCLICSSLSMVPAEWLTKGGMLYQKAADSPVKMVDGVKLSFPFDGISASYSAETDSLSLLEVSCFCCTSSTRKCTGDGSIVYENGDRTQTVSLGSRCGCGYMHYWDGKEYDNLPERVPLSLSWGGRTISIEVYWFQYESDRSRNSNVYQVANKAVSDHFPGEFGSERLVQQVVDHILRVTENREGMEQVSGHHPSKPSADQASPPTKQSPESAKPPAPSASDTEGPSKIILTGHKSRTLHKEELTVSESERNVKKKIQDNAKVAQSKKSHSTSKTTPTSKTLPNSKTPPSSALKPTPKPSGPASKPSGPASKPLEKRIRVSTSDGRTCNLSLDCSVTLAQLQEAISRELNIPSDRQKLRSGFPPRELHPPDDPQEPVNLANGEKVLVEILTPSPPSVEDRLGGGTSQDEEQSTEGQAPSSYGSKDSTPQRTNQALNALLQQMLGKEVDLWSVAQHQPQLFRKGGDYYNQVMEQYGSQLGDNTHIQFKELPNKTFAFNANTESLDLCLGFQHIPVGPLTPQMEQLAMLASVSDGKVADSKHGDSPEAGAASSSSATSAGGQVSGRTGHQVKAFSGKGRTLSSSGAQPTGGSGQLTGGSRVSQADPIRQTARLIAQRTLSTLRETESRLQQQVRALNKKLADADGASVEQDLERQLITVSSELKKIRDEIRELESL